MNTEKYWREKLNDEVFRFVPVTPQDKIIIESFISSLLKQAVEEDRKRIVEKIRKIPVVFINEDYNHEYVDTCDVYKSLQ